MGSGKRVIDNSHLTRLCAVASLGSELPHERHCCHRCSRVILCGQRVGSFSGPLRNSAPSLLDVDRSTWKEYAPLLSAAEVMEATYAA